ncbi:MAG: CvpA family protein [Trichlorobacter sp.]|jgi:membrane protein required for colicin V production
MNLLDISIMIVLALMGLRGLLRGLIKEVAALTALILGGWLAYRYHSVAAGPLKTLLPAAAAEVVAFVLLLILVGLCAHLLGNLLTGLIKLALLGWVNRLGGVVVGLLEGSLILGMIFYAIVAIPFPLQLKETIKKHSVAAPLATFGGTMLDRAKALRPTNP